MTDTAAPLPSSAQRVADLLVSMGHDKPVVMLPSTGRTSAEAAAAVGCDVAEIAKSIIFRRLADDAPVLVIASGGNRVDESKVTALVGPLGKQLQRPQAELCEPIRAHGGNECTEQRDEHDIERIDA